MSENTGDNDVVDVLLYFGDIVQTEMTIACYFLQWEFGPNIEFI